MHRKCGDLRESLLRWRSAFSWRWTMILTVIHAGTTTAAHIIRAMPTVISLPDKPPPRQRNRRGVYGGTRLFDGAAAALS